MACSALGGRWTFHDHGSVGVGDDNNSGGSRDIRKHANRECHPPPYHHRHHRHIKKLTPLPATKTETDGRPVSLFEVEVFMEIFLPLDNRRS